MSTPGGGESDLIVTPPFSPVTFIEAGLRAMEGHGFDSWRLDV